MFSASSDNPDVKEVVFGPTTRGGWKIDVFGNDPGWYDPYGDGWETSLDRVLPLLKRFVSEQAVWTDLSTGKTVSFWQVITSHIEAA